MPLSERFSVQDCVERGRYVVVGVERRVSCFLLLDGLIFRSFWKYRSAGFLQLAGISSFSRCFKLLNARILTLRFHSLTYLRQSILNEESMKNSEPAVEVVRKESCSSWRNKTRRSRLSTRRAEFGYCKLGTATGPATLQMYPMLQSRNRRTRITVKQE